MDNATRQYQVRIENSAGIAITVEVAAVSPQDAAELALPSAASEDKGVTITVVAPNGIESVFGYRDMVPPHPDD